MLVAANDRTFHHVCSPRYVKADQAFLVWLKRQLASLSAWENELLLNDGSLELLEQVQSHKMWMKTILANALLPEGFASP